MKKAFFLAIGIAFFMGFGVFSLNAQSNVKDQLDVMGPVFESEGYELTQEIIFGSMDEGEYASFFIQLKSGWDYQIVAVCDYDCDDIDLCIYDDEENEVDCDESDDAVPGLVILPNQTGEFRLFITMYDCWFGPCEFGIAIYGKEVK